MFKSFELNYNYGFNNWKLSIIDDDFTYTQVLDFRSRSDVFNCFVSIYENKGLHVSFNFLLFLLAYSKKYCINIEFLFDDFYGCKENTIEYFKEIKNYLLFS